MSPTMITIESQLANGHRARGFFRELPDRRAADALIAERYWDDDDQVREAMIGAILAQKRVFAIAYPSLAHRDVLQVFLRDLDGGLVFACVLVSGSRLRNMLAQSSPVIESFALQVLPSEHLSLEGVRAALQCWIERCFPNIAMPLIALERWTGPDGILQELLELLLSPREPVVVMSLAGTDTEEEPYIDPSVVQPPYELAA